MTPACKALALLFDLIGKEVNLSLSLGLMNFCVDCHSNDVFNSHLVAVIYGLFNTLQKQMNKCSKPTTSKSVRTL